MSLVIASCGRCHRDILGIDAEDPKTWNHPDALSTSVFSGPVGARTETRLHWACYVEAFDGEQGRLFK